MPTSKGCRAKGWFRARKHISQNKEWTEEQARTAHNNREMYTAVLGGLESPYCFVEVRDDFISVGFLDDKLREYMTYAFNEYEPGKLFLYFISFRFYDKESDKITKVESYSFSKDGKTVILLKDKIKKTTSKSESIQDLSIHYYDYPEFGDYRVLTRKDIG